MPIRKRPLRSVPQDVRELGKYTRSLEVQVSGSELKIADSDLPATIARDVEVAAAVVAEATARNAAIGVAIASEQTARDTAISDAIATHVAAGDPHPIYTTATELATALGPYPQKAGTETVSGAWSFSTGPAVPNSTVSGLPSASPAARIIYVSDESGGAVLAFSDGTNWRRVTDRAIVS